jgi:hypothetical protein
MATLKAPESTGGYGPQIKDLAPKGTFLATIVDIVDRFGVERPKFEDPSVTEKVDLTIFVLGFKGKDGKFYLVKTRDMKISGHEKSKLYDFLKSLTGEPPKYGWDYCELIGTGAQITVSHQESKRTPGKMYATLGSIAPVMEELKGKVHPLSAFAALLDPDKGVPAGAVASDDEDGSDEPF